MRKFFELNNVVHADHIIRILGKIYGSLSGWGVTCGWVWIGLSEAMSYWTWIHLNEILICLLHSGGLQLQVKSLLIR